MKSDFEFASDSASIDAAQRGLMSPSLGAAGKLKKFSQG